MPNTILLKRSATANATPPAANLAFGELAVNYADGKLYTKKSDGTVVAIGGSSDSLTKTQADGYYQPRLANTTYANQTYIPTIRSVSSYQGELVPNVTNTFGGSGQYKNILNGVVHHPSLPNIPYGYIAGEYFQNVALGMLDSYRLINTDYQEIGLFVKPSGVTFNSAVTVRSDLVSLIAGVDTNCTTMTLSSSEGAKYTPPTGFTLSNQSVMNKSQMDATYIAYSRLGTMTLTPDASGNVYWLADPFKIATISLDRGVRLFFPTGSGLIPGATYTLIVKQNALNTPCDISWNPSQTGVGNYFFPNRTKPALSTVTGYTDIFSFIYDGLNMYGAIQRNFGVGL